MIMFTGDSSENMCFYFMTDFMQKAGRQVEFLNLLLMHVKLV